MFILWTTLGSIIWNTTLIGLGYWLGARYHLVADVIDQYSMVIYVLIAVLILVGIGLLIRRSMKRKKQA